MSARSAPRTDAAFGRRLRFGPWVAACAALLAACGGPRGDAQRDRDACGDPAATIPAIRSPGAGGPLPGQAVAVEAQLVATLPGLDAWVLETPLAQRDTDAATSEGLLLMLQGVAPPIRVGNRVRATGTLVEWREPESGRDGGTRLLLAREPVDCGPLGLPPPLRLDAAPPDWRRIEGMRVHLPGPLTLAANYGLAASGRATVAIGPRPMTPTELHPPGADARAQWQRQELALVEFDPARPAQARDRLWWLGAPPGALEPWRVGTTLAAVDGVVVEATRPRIALLRAPGAVIQAPRPPPPPRQPGTLRVAAANVFNFYNGDGSGGGFPTERGAADAAAMQRQRDKVVAMLAGLDADIVALMEVENDGAGDGSALATLVQALNERPGSAGAWRAVDTGAAAYGGDSIRVALIHRADRATPLGQPQWPPARAFAALNRRPLAQAFAPADGGAPLVVVANHFKSKSGCPAETGPDADARDGQGCWNHARLLAAQALAQWIGERRAAEPRLWDAVLVTGDLNSHAQEDPLRALRAAGFVDLIGAQRGAAPYSYVFDARSGRLDHALATPGLAARARGAGEWHINADEAAAFAYDGDPALYLADAYRASDHDPLWVDFALQ